MLSDLLSSYLQVTAKRTTPTNTIIETKSFTTVVPSVDAIFSTSPSKAASALTSNEMTIASTGITASTAPPTCRTVFFLSFFSTDFAIVGAFSIGAINVRISLNTPSRLSAMVLSVNEVVQITVDANKTANAINLEI